MLFDNRIRRFAGGTILGAGTLGASVSAVLTAAHPAAAAAVVAAVQSAVTCATTAACVSGTNTSSGIGVLGASNTGTGIRGKSSTGAGVEGLSQDSAGILGKSTSDTALAGNSPNTGVYGTGTGVFGVGVEGFGQAESDTGAYGKAGTGVGVRAFSDSGNGLLASSPAGTGIIATFEQGTGVNAFSGSTLANGGHAAVSAQGDSIGLLASATPGGVPLTLSNDLGVQVFSVDAAGNVRLSGALTAFARTAGGAIVTAFSPKTTLPTIEDSGTAQIAGGAAVVRLDPAFAAAIDVRTGYRVFLTPHGDTRGLFVATKAPSGFVVRESQGGRATVLFDYRILATAAGGAGQRMAATRAAQPQASLPPIPTIKSAPLPVAPALP